MANPNNCSTCHHKPNGDEGWCYMFRDEPTDVCMQHSGRRQFYPSRDGLRACLDELFSASPSHKADLK